MFAKSYAESYEALNHKKPYKQEIEFVYDWAHKPKRILDIGAGTGHYWEFYPNRVEVRGIEKSAAMIEQSKYKGYLDEIDVAKFYAQPVSAYHGFDCMTALFDVINYLPDNSWWKNAPLKEGGYFIFDIFDTEKIKKDGFKKTVRVVDEWLRIIRPEYSGGNKVVLDIEVFFRTRLFSHEQHTMYLYDFDDIVELAGEEFDIVDLKKTEGWQMWLKLKKL